MKRVKFNLKLKILEIKQLLILKLIYNKLNCKIKVQKINKKKVVVECN